MYAERFERPGKKHIKGFSRYLSLQTEILKQYAQGLWMKQRSHVMREGVFEIENSEAILVRCSEFKKFKEHRRRDFICLQS
jgi:hypothetical protein